MESNNLDFPSEQMLSCLDMTNTTTQCTSSFDMDDFLDRSCTHAHACNPPGPDQSHTHTCIHVHTQIMSDDMAESDERKVQKRPSGNREAVRKYREKKKARTASLEEEVIRLRNLNRELTKRVQGQALLEAEIVRLKCLLVDVKGRIDGEIGNFPYQKIEKNDRAVNLCDVRCDEIGALNGRDCGFDDLRCMGNRSYGAEEVSIGGNSSRSRKRKGGSLAAKAS